MASSKPRVQGHIDAALYEALQQEMDRLGCSQATAIEEALRITVGMDPGLKQNLLRIAEKERRSLSQQILVIVERYIQELEDV